MGRVDHYVREQIKLHPPISRNVFLEVEMSTVNLMELWKEFAISIKSMRLSRPSTHFISISTQGFDW
jgi:hypothetical protein